MRLSCSAKEIAGACHRRKALRDEQLKGSVLYDFLKKIGMSVKM